VPRYHVFVIQSFNNQGTEDLFNGNKTKEARRICPRALWKIVFRKLDQLDSAHVFEELRVPPGNQLESLARNRKGQHSIRINDQYRLCFEWGESGPEIVEIVDYH